MPSSALTSRSLARLAPLPRRFYVRDPRTVARELLGKLLIRLLPEGGTEAIEGVPHLPSSSGTEAAPPLGSPTLLAGRIVEAEAYLGTLDPGSHAFRGPTARNAVLFGPPGHAYVYFIYGNHYCTNVSCQPPGLAGGVLLRALEPVCGIPVMAARRGLALHDSSALTALGSSPARLSQATLRHLTSGPGRLSQALGITRAQNACDLCSRRGGLYIVADPAADEHPAISAGPRINVSRAPHDPWRFFLTASPFVSVRLSR